MKPRKKKQIEQSFLMKWKGKIMAIGGIAGAVTAILTLASTWDSMGLPRLAFTSDVNEVMIVASNAEVDARLRAKRSDERALFEIDEKIETLHNQKKPVPNELLEQKQRILEDMKDNTDKLNKAIERIK